MAKYKKKGDKMLFIVFVAIGVLSAIAALLFKNKIAVVASLAFIVLAIAIPVGIYTANIGTIAELEAFYVASSENFQIARDDTASYLSEEAILESSYLIPITGSIEKIGVGQSVAERVREYRNSVNVYNSALARYQAYKDSLLYGIAYPTVPDYMRLLIIEAVDK